MQITLPHNPQAAHLLQGSMLAIGYEGSKITVASIQDMF